jgi:1A family penicillin-binding protein
MKSLLSRMKDSKKNLSQLRSITSKGARVISKTTQQGARASHIFIKRRKRFFAFWLLRIAIFAVSFVIALAGILFLWIATQPIPSIQSFEERKTVNSTKIYDVTGEVTLYSVGDSINRKPVESSQIDPKIKNAFIAIEDQNFYQHNGIVIHSTIRGILFTVMSKIGLPVDGSGGSTITQQLVKNTLLTNEYRFTRKLKEWFLAVKLEKKYTKEEILTMYLNEIPFGGNMYGIEVATKSFFGTSADNVTIAQAAYLASIPNAPTLFSPYGKNVAKLEQRKNLVLARMQQANMITAQEYQSAKSEVVEFQPKSASKSKAIHFVEHVRAELESRYGSDVVENGGMQVYTTLDWRLQEKAEEIVAKRALENEKAWNAENQALIAIDPKTGGIRAMVGSRGYEDPDIDGKFNVTTAARQPGSSFKPFIYAKAFEMGYTDQTVLFDVPIQFSTTCPANNFTTTANGNCYSPDNYDDAYVGPINLRNALGGSRNVPAVQLMYLVGPQNAVRFARSLGVNTLTNENRYGLTLVLGGGEATLLDMTSSYAVFANDGIKHDTHAISKITDRNGSVIFERTPQAGTAVVSADAARRLNSVLSDNAARASLFGSNSQLFFGADRPVAAKTGTTNNNKDAWLIGYTPDIAIGVWSGNNDNTPMKKGSIISAPAWRDTMNVALGIYGYTPFNAPQAIPLSTKPALRGIWWGNESVFVDTISGKRATEHTPDETKKEIVVSEPHNILHWVSRSDPTGPVPASPSSDSQYARWESAFQSYLAARPNLIPASGTIPTEYDDIHSPEKSPTITITESSLSSGPDQQLSVAWSARDTDLALVRIIVNGNQLAEIPAPDSTFVGTTTVTLPTTLVDSPTITLAVIAVDSVYNKGEDTVRVR